MSHSASARLILAGVVERGRPTAPSPFYGNPLFAVTGRPKAGEAHIRLAVAKSPQTAIRVKKLLACAIPALLGWNPTWPILDASTCPTCASDGPRRFISTARWRANLYRSRP